MKSKPKPGDLYLLKFDGSIKLTSKIMEIGGLTYQLRDLKLKSFTITAVARSDGSYTIHDIKAVEEDHAART